MSRRNYPSQLRRSRPREEPVRDDPPWVEETAWYHWQHQPENNEVVWMGIVFGECPGNDEFNVYLTEGQHMRVLEDEDTYGPTWVEKA